jgi:hypothetical protein
MHLVFSCARICLSCVDPSNAGLTPQNSSCHSLQALQEVTTTADAEQLAGAEEAWGAGQHLSPSMQTLS